MGKTLGEQQAPAIQILQDDRRPSNSWPECLADSAFDACPCFSLGGRLSAIGRTPLRLVSTPAPGSSILIVADRTRLSSLDEAAGREIGSPNMVELEELTPHRAVICSLRAQSIADPVFVASQC